MPVWFKFDSSEGIEMNIMLRTQSFAYVTDFDIADAGKYATMKAGDEFVYEKVKYEVVEVNKSSGQIVLTLKEAEK